jgi:hypothetical protein
LLCADAGCVWLMAMSSVAEIIKLYFMRVLPFLA